MYVDDAIKLNHSNMKNNGELVEELEKIKNKVIYKLPIIKDKKSNIQNEINFENQSKNTNDLKIISLSKIIANKI